jgi:tetratricopeptide (TPR) repeat protein
MATFYSLAKPMTKMKLAMTGLFLLQLAGLSAAETPINIYAERAEKAFQQAQAQFQAAADNATNAWNFARTTFDFCQFSKNDAQRADIARLGIAACKQQLSRAPKSAPDHYYLAMNYGELADAEAPSIAAYKLVKEVEREFKTAAELDEHFDFAGPARNLGELYFQAPSWPLSVGSRHKAREFLERAATLAPEYPENLLNLAEAQLQWRQAEDAEKTLRKLDRLWPAAQTNFTGSAWEQSWGDWRSRRRAAKTEAGRLANGKSIR